MAKDKFPVTPAIRLLKQKKADYTPFQYEYEEKGGTAQTASELSVEEHAVIKTLVIDGGEKDPFIILMHGDKEVSMKNLARELDIKTAQPASLDMASKATGYQFGGTSPFGTKKQLRITAEKTIFDLDYIYINGGKQGFILKMKPHVLKEIFNITEVEVAI